MPKFTVGVQETRRDIQVCFERWGITNWLVSDSRNSERNEAWIKFTHPKLGPRQLSCGDYSEYYENLRALYITIDDIRKAEGRGILEQYRQFFEALPAPEANPYKILGLTEGASIQSVKEAYRKKATEAHPDKGGSSSAMAAVNEAYEKIRKDKGF